jgi:DNA-binding MarR family transcriptional regulator
VRGTADKLSPSELAAWQGFIRLDARLSRVLDADLRREHRLTANGYDVLIQLGLAPGRRLRITTLAEEVLMSPSGLSRLVDALERDGLVERERNPDDARSFDVVLTPAGRTLLRAANRTHLQRVREAFLGRLTDAQLDALADAWRAVDPALVDGRRRAAE